MEKEDYIMLFIIFHILFTLFTINLSYISNNNKYNLKSILLAIFAPYIYVYHIYLKDNNNLITTINNIRNIK